MSGKSVKTLRKRFLTMFHPDDKTAWRAFKKNARGDDVQVQHDTENKDELLAPKTKQRGRDVQV